MKLWEFQKECRLVWAAVPKNEALVPYFLLNTVDGLNLLAKKNGFSHRFQSIGGYAFMIDPDGEWSFELN